MKFTTHLHLVPKVKMSGSVLLLPIYAFLASWKGISLPLYLAVVTTDLAAENPLTLQSCIRHGTADGRLIFKVSGSISPSLTLILRRSRTGTLWFYTSTSNKTAARPKLYTKSLTRDLKRMYSRLTLVRISINL